ncbi:MAG: hypothetical protein PHU46_00840 [Rhodocyclaceae bacterium]|nr:hypothetical protein [Rhodocyclaceae bacterium]
MRIRTLFGTVLLGAVALFASAAWSGEGSGIPKPDIVISNPGKCVADVDTMRRTHMDMLKHQRDLTMRQGIRGAKVSLNACIDCHASKSNGSVLGSDQNFCQTCHAYAAVKLDCFECHQAKASHPIGAAAPAEAVASKEGAR